MEYNMPTLGRKTPCNDCPFRKNAAKGWLGASTPEEFVYTTLGEVPMPCHKTVDYSDPDWEETQLPDADLCAGSLQFMANQCKMPRDRELANAVRAVGTNPNVMSRPQEFLDYHTNQMNDFYVEAHRE